MGNKKILKNYLYNLLYQILSVITPLITTPYITRVLGPTNLGVHGYVSSIAAYFVLFGAVGTSLYGSREIAYYQDNPQKRTEIFHEIVSIRLIFTIIAAFLYIILFCLNNNYSVIYRIFILEVVANALDISWFFQGLQDFKKTVLRNIAVKLIGIILIFALVRDESSLPLYSVCTTLPILLGHLTLWPYLNSYLVKGSGERRIARHIKPILALFVPQVAVDVYTVLDKTMIGVLSTDIADVGFYTQTQKVIKLSLTIVTSIGIVMLPAMALDYKKKNDEGLQKAVHNSFRFMSFVGIPMMFGIMGISEDFVPWFMGKGYDKCIVLLRLSAPLIVLISYSTVIGSQYLLATKQQGRYTISIVCGSIVNFFGNYMLIPKYNAVGATAASVFAEFTVSIIQIFFTRDRLSILKYTLHNWKIYISSIIMLAIILVVSKYMMPSIWTTMFQIIVGISIYMLLSYLLKTDEMLWLWRLFKDKTKKNTISF